MGKHKSLGDKTQAIISKVEELWDIVAPCAGHESEAERLKGEILDELEMLTFEE